MIDNETHNKNIKYDLVKAMLPHVPFDGWTWTAVENGSIDIGFEKTKDNNYQLIADLSFWDQSTPVDAFLDSLHKEYAITTVLEETKKQGFETISQIKNQQNGEVVISVEKWTS